MFSSVLHGISVAILLTSSAAFSLQSSFLRPQLFSSICSNSHVLVMRDASASYWFKVGDCVKVVEDVAKAGTNLRDRVGMVVETWEKCDVDPTCCCAEQVDSNMAVRVQFEANALGAEDEGSFEHYFAEEELQKVTDARQEPVAFGGMSCAAFKLDQLQLNDRPRKIASFDPNQPNQ